MTIDRRMFVEKMLVGTGLLYFFPKDILAANDCNVAHPLMPPNKTFPGKCHNCGMTRPMWARTWHTYELDGQELEVCSMHCLAEATMNSETTPQNVQVALYLAPEKSIAADQSFYVVGSKARGTMTMNSKLAFATKREAEAFAAECGGAVVSFSSAYQAAAKTIEKENLMINRNRISKGKIVEPVDNKDICPVCDMYPARYPKNKCQLQTSDGEVVHFCSTQCLFEYLKNSQKYRKTDLTTKFIWVVDYDNGNWIYAQNAFYVVNSDVAGPMGKEAYPFVNIESAKKFSSMHPGKVLRFKEVTIETIMS